MEKKKALKRVKLLKGSLILIFTGKKKKCESPSFSSV